MEKETKQKICLVSSSGGHFEQLLCLRKLSEDYDCFILQKKQNIIKMTKR